MSLADGTYRATPTDAVLSESKEGNPQIAVTFSLIDDPASKITWFGSFKSEASTEIALKALRAMGWTGNDLSVFEFGNDMPHEMAGVAVEIVVETEDYEGKSRTKVKWVNAPGGGVAVKNPMSAPAVKSFAARMKAAIAAFDAQNGKPTPKPAPKNGSSDAEIPF